MGHPRAGSSNPSQEIRSLTGLRGVAAIVVVLYHYQLAATNKGYLAVDLFFVLSGFVMATSYGAALHANPGLGAYGKFLFRRFARIYPIYVVVLALTFLADADFGAERYATLATNVLLVQQFGLDFVSRTLGTSIVGQTWSISAEVGAYLAFPLLLRATWSSKRIVLVATALAAAATLVVIVMFVPLEPLQAGPLDNHWYLSGLSRCIAEFVLGMLVFRLWKAGLRCPDWIGWATLAALVLLSFRRRSDLPIVACLVVLVFAAAQVRSSLARVLSLRPVHFLGEISYSLYLVHILGRLLEPAAVSAAERLGFDSPQTAALLSIIAFDLAFATVTFYAIEKPARDWLREAFEGRRPRAIETEPSAP